MVQPSQTELDRRKVSGISSRAGDAVLTPQVQLVEFTVENIRNVSSNDYPQYYPGEDHSWSLDKFRNVSYPLANACNLLIQEELPHTNSQLQPARLYLFPYWHRREYSECLSPHTPCRSADPRY